MPETTSELSITAQLFNAAGVKRVVFVDDRFGISQERIQSDANDLSIEQLQKCGAFPNVDFSGDNEDIHRSAVTKAIEQATTGELEVVFDKMADLGYGYDDSEKDHRARDYFDKVVATVAETLYLSHTPRVTFAKSSGVQEGR